MPTRVLRNEEPERGAFAFRETRRRDLGRSGALRSGADTSSTQKYGYESPA
jgi:hypothetical protein